MLPVKIRASIKFYSVATGLCKFFFVQASLFLYFELEASWMKDKLLECRPLLRVAPVAQLDRVPGYELGGREFESLRARQ